MLQHERTQWEQERKQYQERITALQVRLAAPGVQIETHRKKEIRSRVDAIRQALEDGPSQVEANALALELAQLEPQLG
jgi:anti-sigma28 factor (negative regulator of flagellin synthesis)